MTEQSSLLSGDLITVSSLNLLFECEGFSYTTVTLQQSSATLSSLFILQKQSSLTSAAICYNEPIRLVHYLSRKYLSKSNSNKCELRLVSQVCAACEFTISALYKCQVGKVKTNEEVIIRPMKAHNEADVADMAVVVRRFDAHSHLSAYVLKNEYSPIIIHKKGTTKHIPFQYRVWMLSNLQNNTYLQVTNKGNIDIQFYQQKHMYQNYIVLQTKNTDEKEIDSQESILNKQIFIKIYAAKLYIAINHEEKVQFKEYLTEDSVFIFQQYDRNQPQIIKIRHKCTNKYFSISKNFKIGIEHFQLQNTFNLVAIQSQYLKSILFINSFFETIKNILSNKKQFTFEQKKLLKFTLKQLSEFIYGQKLSSVQQNFIEMKPMSTKLSSLQKQALIKINLSALMTELIMKLIIESNQQSQTLQLLKNTLCISVAVYLQNIDSVYLLFKHLYFLCQHITKLQGLIQWFFQLISNKQVYKLFQQSIFPVGKKQMKSIQIMLLFIEKNSQMSAIKKVKIFELLKLLSLWQSMHKTIFAAYCSKKLKNIFLELNSKHNNLLINHENSFQQLQQLTISYKNKQIVTILLAQLRFLSRLCSHRCKQFLTSLITIDVLRHYLKNSINQDIQSTFIYIFVNNYLQKGNINHFLLLTKTKLDKREEESDLSTRLLVPQSIEMSIRQQKAGVKKIGELLIYLCLRSIEEKQIDFIFYLNLGTIKVYNETFFIEEQFFAALKQLLEDLCRNQIKQQNVRNIIIEICSILLTKHKKQLLALSNIIIKSIQGNNETNLFIDFQKYYEQIDFKLTINLIQICVLYKDVIFSLSQLLRAYYYSRQIMLSFLRNKIIIFSDWQLQFYQHCQRQYQILQHQIQKFCQNNDSKDVTGTITQLNELFFFNSLEKEGVINHYAQNIIRQIGFVKAITQILIIKQIYYQQKQLSQFFKQCFMFIKLMITKSTINLKEMQPKITEVKQLFGKEDRGQGNILLQMSKYKEYLKFVYQNAIKCLMNSFSRDVLVALLNTLNHNIYFIEIQKMFQKQQFINNLFLGTTQSIGLGCKCVQLIIQNSSQTQYIKKNVKKTFPLNKVIFYLEKFILQSNNIIAAQQLMKLCINIYKQQLFHLAQCQQVLSFIQKLINLKQYVANDSISQDIKLIQQLRAINKNQPIQGQLKKLKNSSYVLTIIIFPFLIQLLQYLFHNQNYQTEITLTANLIYQKYKQQLQKLTFADCSKYCKQYRLALTTCSQILKKPLQLKYDLIQQEEEQQNQQSQTYFFNLKIQPLLYNFIDNNSSQSKAIYKSIIQIMHTKFDKPKLNIFTKPTLHAVFNACLQGNKLQLLHFYASQYTKDHLFEQKCVNLSSLYNSVNIEQHLPLLISLQSILIRRNIPLSPIIHSQLLCQISKILSDEKNLYLNNSINEQCILYQTSLSELSFQIYPQRFTIQLLLQWVKNKTTVETNPVLMSQTYALLKVYLQFLSSFQFKYLPKQLNNKIQLSLTILYQYCVNSKQCLTSLQQMFNEVNTILDLDDGYQRNVFEASFDTGKLLNILMKYRIKSMKYIHILSKVYSKSLLVYGQNQLMDYPLVPTRAQYSNMKNMVVLIMKQYKLADENVSGQFYARINMKIIQNNILECYKKHAAILGEIQYEDEYGHACAHEYNAMNNYAVQLMAIKIDSSEELKQNYVKMRVEMKSKSYSDQIVNNLFRLIRGIVFIIIGCCRKRKYSKDIGFEEAFRYYQKMVGRVQLVDKGQLIQWWFPILPQCTNLKKLKSIFISRLDFLSVDMKRQSIRQSLMQNANYSMFYFKNEYKFYKRFKGLKMIFLLEKHLFLFQLLSYFIIIASNLVLQFTPNRTQESFFSVILGPFQILVITNILICTFIFIMFVLKQIPLIICICRYDLQSGKGLFSFKYLYRSPRYQTFILSLRVLLQGSLLYNIVYLFLICLVAYNKLIISILLIDVLYHIPILNRLLMSLWKPKLQLILAFVVFTILQYFFSIFMFIFFKNEADGNCNEVSDCFVFILISTYKTFSGFVGYLFQKQVNNNHPIELTITSFAIFEQVYVIVVFQIFFSLVLAIVVDSFTVNKAELEKRRDNIENICIVCNLDRSYFNQINCPFADHVAAHHHVYTYFALKYYLKQLLHSHLNHFQKAIIRNQSAEWFPSFKTITKNKQL